MTTDQALAVFDSAVRARGLAVATSEFKGVVLATAESERAGAIRLSWDWSEDVLSLEVTHGPPDQPPVGWLDLYRATVGEGVLVPDQSDFDFKEALSHGPGPTCSPPFTPAP